MFQLDHAASNSFTEIIAYAVPGFILFMIVEGIFARGHEPAIYEKKDTITSLSMGIGKMVTGFAANILVLIGLGFAYWVSPFQIVMDSWWKWAIAVVFFDFLFYWMHRTHHEVRIGWAGHVTHHSSQHYNYSTALRQSWTEQVTGIPFWMVMAFCGFNPQTVLITYAFSLIYQFLMHTELVGKLGPLEWFMNTPSHHRVHHGTNFDYLDRNYAGTFIIWDRLFGTFQVEKDDEPVKYGLITNIETYNPIKVAFHEWADMLRDAWKSRSVVTAFQILFKPPGWKPGDDSYTVRAQRAALARGEVPSLLAPPIEPSAEARASSGET